MRRKAPSQTVFNFDSLTSKRIEHMKRASRRRYRLPTERPNIGVNVTLLFHESSLATVDAYEQRAVEQSQRCGPRHSATAREVNSLTKADLTALREAEPAIMAFIAAKPEHAALFAYDPLAALKLLEKPLGRTLLAKLQLLMDASSRNAGPLPNVRIGRMTVKVKQEQRKVSENQEAIDLRHAE